MINNSIATPITTRAGQIVDQALKENKYVLCDTVQDLARRLARAEAAHSQTIIEMGKEHAGVRAIDAGAIAKLQDDLAAARRELASRAAFSMTANLKKVCLN